MSQVLVATITLLLLTACGARHASPHNDIHGFYASPTDPSGIHFLPGRPRANDRFEDALASDTDRKALYENLAYFSEGGAEFLFQVTGHTDDSECDGEACVALSKRRAVGYMVWLVHHGFPQDSLIAPIGYGDSRPLELKVTEESRSRDRRAEINVVEGGQ